MPNEKPLPENDDIIDLTDLVEEESAASAATEAAAEKDAAADMSFEQELDDLFGDVEPEAAKPGGQAEADAGDEDVIDLEGMELPEPEAAPTPTTEPEAAAAPAPAEPEKTEADEDIMDLAGLDFNALETPSAEEASEAAPEEAAVEAEPATDLSDLEAALGEAASAAEEAAAAPEEPFPAEEPATVAEAPDEAPQPAPEEAAAAPEEAPQPPVQATAPEEAMDVADLPVTPLAETPAAAAASEGTAAESIDLDALDELILTAKGPVPETEETPDEDALAAWNARLDALEAATTALTTHIGDIRIPDSEALATRLEASLTTRFDALRSELAAEADKPAGHDPEALRTELMAAIEAARPDRERLVEDLRTALAPDFDAVRQSLPDTENFITQKDLKQALAGLREGLSVDLGAVLETAKKAATEAVRQLGETLGARLDALEAGHADVAALDERIAALEAQGATEALIERLAALEAESQAGKALTERVDALEADHQSADALTEQVRQALRPDIPDVQAAIAGVREGLAVDLAAALQTAKQAARDEAKAMGDALAERVSALETDRIDPDALADRVQRALAPSAEELETAKQTAKQALGGLDERMRTTDFEAAMAAFRKEMEADIARRIPQTAAAILRREIAALIKEFS